MKGFVPSWSILIPCATVLGGVGLFTSFTVSGEPALESGPAGAASGAFNPASGAPVSTPAIDPAFVLCHTPSSAAATRAIIRLAASHTEVPPMPIRHCGRDSAW
jgi:hypothetical protein